MKPLDFLIIGAQKSATTTLFELLREHHRIAMPIEKEVPFFTGDSSADAWRIYCERYFGNAGNDALWGKATPQYMCTPGTAGKIRSLMPAVKLVAILRDPIDRCWSHYQMGKRRATEHRDFETAIEELLTDEHLARGRAGSAPEHRDGFQSESAFYITWSEYGRVLQEYLEFFPHEQLLVLYTEELEQEPERVLDRLLAFLGLEVGIRPEKLGRKIHQGGGANRIPHTVRVALRKLKPLYLAWQMLPPEHQGRLRFLYERWNVKKKQGDKKIASATREKLRTHFTGDLELFQTMPFEKPAWLKDYCH